MLYPFFLSFSFVEQAAMQSYENKGADVYSNGSAGHIHGAELNRMKEVAFEKSPLEPMVKHKPAHTHICFFSF